MAVFYHSGELNIHVETPKSKGKHLGLVLLSFGLLCVLQATLNISLRLAQKVDRCQQNWLTLDYSCYYVASGRRSWDSSRQDCLERGADLVIINSRKEQDFIIKLTESAWIGMTDRDVEGRWTWVDGTPVDRTGLHWAPGQPDGAFGGEDCGDIRATINFTGLNDYNCGGLTRWICEKTLQ